MRWVQTPSLLPFPDLTQPEVAYPLYVQPEVNPRYVSRIDGVYLQNLDMDELIEKVRSSLRPLSCIVLLVSSHLTHVGQALLCVSTVLCRQQCGLACRRIAKWFPSVQCSCSADLVLGCMSTQCQEDILC